MKDNEKKELLKRIDSIFKLDSFNRSPCICCRTWIEEVEQLKKEIEETCKDD